MRAALQSPQRSKGMRQMHLSARPYHRVLKVSRTMADLEGAEGIQTPHLAQALQYRVRVLETSFNL